MTSKTRSTHRSLWLVRTNGDNTLARTFAAFEVGFVPGVADVILIHATAITCGTSVLLRAIHEAASCRLVAFWKRDNDASVISIPRSPRLFTFARSAAEYEARRDDKQDQEHASLVMARPDQRRQHVSENLCSFRSRVCARCCKRRLDRGNSACRRGSHPALHNLSHNRSPVDCTQEAEQCRHRCGPIFAAAFHVREVHSQRARGAPPR
jgi:hypothetical protein